MKSVTLLILTTVFTLVAGGIDIYLGMTWITQMRAYSFPVAPGVITQKSVRTIMSRHPYAAAELTYEYSVSGHRYQGHDVRLGPTTEKTEAQARAYLSAWTEGGSVRVYYDPSDPARAVLRPGLDGVDLHAAMFALVFTLAAAMLWVMLFNATIGLPNHRVDGGLRSFSAGQLWHVRLDIFYPWGSLFGWLYVGLCIGVFIGFFSVSRTGELSFALMGTIWLAILVAALGTFFYRLRMQESGAADLIIDADRGVLELPRYRKPTERITLSLSDVQDVKVETVERARSRGGVSYSYQVMLHLRTGSPVQVLEWGNPDRASAFSWWLKGKIEDAAHHHT